MRSLKILGRALWLGSTLALTACASSSEPVPREVRMSPDSVRIPADAMEAEARNYAACRFAPAASDDRPRRFAGVRFLLPSEYIWAATDAVVSNAGVWTAQDSAGFFLGFAGSAMGYDPEVLTVVSEPPCALQVLGRTLRFDLELAHSPLHPDTVFIARALLHVHDEPAIIATFARSRAQRERLLGAAASLAVESW